jgi:hypothetical protein
MKTVFIALFCLLGLAKITKASEFKLDQCFIGGKFENACEVSLDEFVVSNRIADTMVSEIPHHFLVGLTSFVIGTFGVHRFIMHQESSGYVHMFANIGAAAAMLAGIIATGSSSGISSTAYGLGISLITFSVVFELVHIAFTVVEGVVYICTPQSKFTKKGGLLYDQSFCAPFKRHLNK